MNCPEEPTNDAHKAAEVAIARLSEAVVGGAAARHSMWRLPARGLGGRRLLFRRRRAS